MPRPAPGVAVTVTWTVRSGGAAVSVTLRTTVTACGTTVVTTVVGTVITAVAAAAAHEVIVMNSRAAVPASSTRPALRSTGPPLGARRR